MAATGPSGFKGTPFETITQGMAAMPSGAESARGRTARALPRGVRGVRSPRRRGVARRLEGADGYQRPRPWCGLLTPPTTALATHMNGLPLSPDHGYPLRALLPGVAGARNVKRLQSVSLQQAPVDAPWNEYYYKNAKAEQIQELPLQSLILSCERSVDSLVVKGVAYSGGSGNAIAKVEVSTDEGESWQPAEIHSEEIVQDGSRKKFGWVRWTATASTLGRGTALDGKIKVSVAQPMRRGPRRLKWPQAAGVPLQWMALRGRVAVRLMCDVTCSQYVCLRCSAAVLGPRPIVHTRRSDPSDLERRSQNARSDTRTAGGHERPPISAARRRLDRLSDFLRGGKPRNRFPIHI